MALPWTTIFPVFIPKTGPGFRKSIDYAIVSGEKYAEEYRLLPKDGKVRWVLARGKCFYNEAQKSVRFAGVVVDITDRKATALNSRASESKLRALVESNMIGVMQWNIDGTITDANDQFLKMTGYSRKDLQSGKLTWKNITPPEYWESDHLRLKALADGKIFSPFEKQYFRKDGSRISVILGGAFYEGSEYTGMCWTLEIAGRTVIEDENQKLAAIIGASSDFIALFSAEGKYTYVNPAGLELIGLEGYEDYKVIDTVFPDDRELVERVLLPRLSKEGFCSHEIRLLNKKTGKPIWMLWNGLTIKDADSGKISSFATISQNISERKQWDEALKKSERNFRSIFKQTIVGISQADLLGRFTLVNDLYSQMVGRSKDELYQMTLYDITYQEDLPRNIPLLKKTIEGGVPFRMEKRYIRPDGSVVWVDISVSAVKDPDGRPLYILGVCQDITERKQAEEALKESEQRFRNIADATPHFIWALNPDGSIKYANKFTLEFLGISLEELNIESWLHYIHPEDVQCTKDILNEAVTFKKSFHLEHRLLDLNGDYRWVLMQGAPSYFPNGELYGYVGSSVDITPLKQSEKALALKNEQLVRINNDLDNFIYTASHDLNPT